MSTWFVERRLEWIRESVEIFGRINREHVMQKFGISAPQVSVDFAEVERRWPEMMRYDKNIKCYVRNR